MKSMSRRAFGKLALGLGTSVLIGGVELRFLPHALAADTAIGGEEPVPTDRVVPIDDAPHAVAPTAVNTPAIAGTSAWGARAATEPVQVINSKPTGIVVHNTQSGNSTDYSLGHAYELARSIQYSHIYERGWIDTGQQFTISRGGYILEGRHRSLEALSSGTTHCVGAHTHNYNTTHLGIECEGSYGSITPPNALYNQLVALCAYMCEKYGISTSEIKGHRDFNATDCPGDALYAMLPQLRRDVQAALDGGPAQTWPLLREGDWNRRVTAAEYLLRHRGYSVKVDGLFDAQTTSATQAFQSANGLTADGVIGAATFTKLITTVRKGDNNNAVRAIQTLLQITADGIFGSGTEASVKQLQQSKGLTVDGIVGPNTWQAAFNLPL